MKIILLFVSITVLSGQVFANEDSANVLSLLSGNVSDAPPPGQGSSSASSSNTDPIEIQSATSSSIEGACTEEQTILPQKFFLGLFKGNPKSLNFNRELYASKLTFSGNGHDMIGNCNSMIKVEFSHPQKGLPYTFQVRIKKPTKAASACGKGKGALADKVVCEYKVQTMKDGKPHDEEEPRVFEPTFNGFKKCLESTGVTANNTFNKKAVAYTKFTHTERNVNRSGTLSYYCRGPECSDPSLSRQAVSQFSKRVDKCQHFEPIRDGEPYRIKSIAEVDLQNKQDEFQVLCKKGYKEIQNLLPEFRKHNDLYSELLKISKAKILQEVKDIHNSLKPNKKGKYNYSKLSAKKIKEVLSDFDKTIIDPLKEKILTYIEKGLDPSALIEKLRKYVQADYVTLDDYNKMLDFSKKAPLHKKDWREAALLSYRNNITAYHLSRYIPDYAEEYKLEEDLLTSEVEDEIENSMDEQIEKVRVIGKLATDKNYSAVNEHKQNQADLIYENQEDLAKIQYAIAENKSEYTSQCTGNRPSYSINQVICSNILKDTQALNQDLVYFQSEDYRKAHIYPKMEEEKNYIATYSPYEAGRNNAFGIKAADFVNINRALRDPRVSGTMVGPNGQLISANSNDPYARYYQQMALERQRQQGQYRVNQPSQSWGQYNTNTNVNYRMPASNGFQLQMPSFNAGYQGQFNYRF